MSVISVPSPTRLGTTLGELRGQIAEFRAKGEKLELELNKRRAAQSRAQEQATSQNLAATEQLRAGLAEQQRRDLAHAAHRFQARHDRIQKAQSNGQRRATHQIDQLAGREIFGYQKGTLEAEKRRDAALVNAQERLATMTATIAQGNDEWLKAETALLARFGVFGRFRHWLSPEYPWPAADVTPDEEELIQKVRTVLPELESAAQTMRRRFLPTLFRLVPVWLLIVGGGAGWLAAVYGLPFLHRTGIPWPLASQFAAGALVLFASFRGLAQYQNRSLAQKTAISLADVRYWLAAAAEKAEARYQIEIGRIQTEYQATLRRINEQWANCKETAIRSKTEAIQRITRQQSRANARNERLQQFALARIERQYQLATIAAEHQIGQRRQTLTSTTSAEAEEIERDWVEKRTSLVSAWEQTMNEYAAFFAAAVAQGNDLAPAWNAEFWKQWQPPAHYAGPAKIGSLTLEMTAFAGAPTAVSPLASQLRFPWPNSVSLPLWLAYPEAATVVIETDKTGANEAGAALNNLAFRLLCQMPPGRLKLTVLDPVGLGQSFASLMHLADYAEAQGGTSQRIWTEPQQIEARLAELTEHLEKVIQMYLRNEFTHLVDYNAHAGSTAERHHLLLVTGFPVNFSESAARRLVNLLVNGGRCGILTLLHWDRRQPLPPGFVADELRNVGVHLVHNGSEFTLDPNGGPGVHLQLDAPPPPELATELLHRIGRGSRDANKVEVPFAVVAPTETAIWTESTLDEIRVPIGRTGASKLQYLSLGRGTRQHALISGKTGSGKSNLLHVIITNLALRCGPNEIEFYLVDFKKGVEFKAYATARLPQARVVAIESDREFGLSVLERLDEELRRRGELFRDQGVQDIPGYRHAGGAARMPRCLLLVDEFQEYFVQEDRISQNAAVLLDRIVRQGRAFGIHVILASQTLGGTYALARATLGQMAVRIAFHCDEADAYLIMGDENPAPKLLSRPGEGIYNDAAGALEANSPFQAVWLPDDVRERALLEIRLRNAPNESLYPGPIVFEGSAPARMETNTELQNCLEVSPNHRPEFLTAWLGAPNSIKGPTAALFARNSGANLLIVGQRDEAALSVILASLISLAAQIPAPSARFVIVDSLSQGTIRGDLLTQVLNALPQSVERILPGQLPAALTMLSDELNRRQTEDHLTRLSLFLIIVGLQNCKKLKPDDSYRFSPDAHDPSANASALFQTIYTEGPSLGIHSLISVDSYNNANRYLGRKGLSEFEMRVLFQMSASDSSSLSDLPTASHLGLYGAVYYQDREGRSETFRPYALPENSWLKAIAPKLRRSG